jgi:hypothetical protein
VIDGKLYANSKSTAAIRSVVGRLALLLRRVNIA